MAVAHHQAGRLDEAVAGYGDVLALAPDHSDALNNLGIVLKDLGRPSEAAASLRRALQCKPDYPEAHNNLGAALCALGRLAEAEESFRSALALKPDYISAQCNLGSILMASGRPEEALGPYLAVLRANDSRQAKNLFVNCVKRLRFTHYDEAFRAALARAILEPWCPPVELMRACNAQVKLNPGIGASAALTDPLLHAILISAPVCDIELERILTTARHAMLAAIPADGALGFHCALAQQCFINEYVFHWTADEANRAQALRDSLNAALETEAPIPVSWPVAVASYFPLYSLPLAARLLDRAWPDEVAALLTQQIREPEAERRLRAATPRLTAIDDGVSQLVRQQYEENPYPRWVRAAPVDSPVPFDLFIRNTLPFASFRPLGKTSDLDVLIAGCGSGQHAIDSSRLYAGARVLAIDLSLASLGYAQRKTAELGLSMIEYAQADITKLDSLARDFDVIEASGVLHHLADPMAGWRVLLGLLRPGGFMRLGLYSEAARRDVVQGRAFIAKHKYGASPEEIRRCRQELIAAGENTESACFLLRADFFSTSACRDLLFHVQEHRLTLDEINAFLEENALQFVGFEIDGQVLQAYRQRFPNDRTATNLRQWQVFEAENPDTFRGMYQFWVQKQGHFSGKTGDSGQC